MSRFLESARKRYMHPLSFESIHVGDVVFYGPLPRPSKFIVELVHPQGYIQIGWRTWPVSYVLPWRVLYVRKGDVRG